MLSEKALPGVFKPLISHIINGRVVVYPPTPALKDDPRRSSFILHPYF